MLVGGLEHEFYDFPYMGDKSSSQLTNSLHHFSEGLVVEPPAYVLTNE